jgi:arsenate reductase
MNEVGIDLGGHTSKTFDRLLGQPWDYVVTVCDSANERCPVFPARMTRLHWSFEDPSTATGSEEKKLQTFRRIRDEIQVKIRSLISGPAPAVLPSPGECE